MSNLTDKPHLIDQKHFWDSLQFDNTTTGASPTKEDLTILLERGFIFLYFFKGCSSVEISNYQKLLEIKNHGYVILLHLLPKSNQSLPQIIGDEFLFHKKLKNSLVDTPNLIGPLLANRLPIVVGLDYLITEQEHKSDSTDLCQRIIEYIEENYNVVVKAFIGSLQGIYSFYSSYIHTLSCQNNKQSKIVHYISNKKTPETQNNSIDYLNLEQHLFEAVRQHKPDAFNYFGILMDWIRPYDDDIKRSKIFELLTIVSFAQRFDESAEIGFIDYVTYSKQFMSYSGEELIQNAFQRFIVITNHFHSDNRIDYSNHIVQATKEYLESHYAEEITLVDIAAVVNISPQYFSKLIKKTTGFNFIDWLSMLRVKKAKDLLVSTNLTVKEVGFLVGYKDPNYFSRIFKKRNGMTPSEYVKSFRS